MVALHGAIPDRDGIVDGLLRHVTVASIRCKQRFGNLPSFATPRQTASLFAAARCHLRSWKESAQLTTKRLESFQPNRDLSPKCAFEYGMGEISFDSISVSYEILLSFGTRLSHETDALR